MTETPAPYRALSDTTFEAQYRRILEATGCKTQVQLADFFEIRQSSISDAKRRKAIPAEWLIKLFDKKRINPDWIRTGNSGRLLRPAEALEPMPLQAAAIEFRPAQECSTDELLIELVRRVFRD